MRASALRRHDARKSGEPALNQGDNPMSAVQQLAREALPREAVVPHVERRSRYFQGMSILLLAIVLTGFSRTFFLRALFAVPPLAPHIYVHAVLMTAWFTLLVVQTSLVAAHRTDLHRRLGVIGAVLAVAMAGVSLVTALGLPAHFKADPVPNGTPMSPAGMIQIVWGNFATIALFCVFVSTAIWMRRRPEAHKRLLLLASISMVSPAIGRYVVDLNLWAASASVPAVVQVLLILVIALVIALPLTLVVHDLRTRRRLHPATAWGVAGYFVVGLGFQIGVSATAAGRALIIGLQS
jgi:hypothetical protein